MITTLPACKDAIDTGVDTSSDQTTNTDSANSTATDSALVDTPNPDINSTPSIDTVTDVDDNDVIDTPDISTETTTTLSTDSPSSTDTETETTTGTGSSTETASATETATATTSATSSATTSETTTGTGSETASGSDTDSSSSTRTVTRTWTGKDKKGDSDPGLGDVLDKRTFTRTRSTSTNTGFKIRTGTGGLLGNIFGTSSTTSTRTRTRTLSGLDDLDPGAGGGKNSKWDKLTGGGGTDTDTDTDTGTDTETSSTTGRMYGPFPSWLNVQTDFGAVGDGVTDDTAAIQTALDELGGGVTGHGGQRVLYFPAGEYKITNRLMINDGDETSATKDVWRSGIALVGEDPKTTILKWEGAEGGILFATNLIKFSRIQRLTFDGGGADGVGMAGTAIHLRTGNGDGTGTNETTNELSDLIIKDAGYGIRAGEYISTGSDTISILRCKFLRNSIAGYQSNGANTLAISIRDSYFEDNYIGVTNADAGTLTWNTDASRATGGYYTTAGTSGNGNFHVLSSLFVESGLTDILVHPSSFFGIRRNISLGSNAFFMALINGNNGSPLTLQGNLILDPLLSIPIQFESYGPITLLDNTVRSLATHTGPVVYSTYALDLASVGNTFTVENPYSLTYTDTDQDNNPDTTFAARHIEIDTAIVNRDTIATTTPSLPKTPAWHTGPVIEVAVPTDSTASATSAIQQAIDEAATQQELGPIVHLPAGLFNVDKTLTIPANSDIRIVGDGFFGEGPNGTLLKWTGSDTGPVIKLLGPSRATLQDLMVNGQDAADGIVVENADQAGSRIYGELVFAGYNTSTGIFADGLDETLVELHESNALWQAGDSAFKVVGGSNADRGRHGTGRMNLFEGSSGGNQSLVADVSRGGRLLLQDIYHENDSYELPFLQLTDRGTVTIDIAKMQRKNGDDPIVDIVNFDGKVTLMGVLVTKPIQISGTSLTKVLTLGALGTNYEDSFDYFTNSSTEAQASLLNSRRNGYGNSNDASATYTYGSWSKPNQGSDDSAFILKMLKHVRSEKPLGDRTTIPDGATDVRLIRVWASHCVNGFHFQRGTSGSGGTEETPDDASGTGTSTGGTATGGKDCPASAAATHTGDLTIDSVEDAAVLSGKCRIDGTLTVNASSLTDLSVLASIIEVTGTVDIKNNAALTSLSGLGALHKIGGSLWITGNAALSSVDSVSALESVSDVLIENNAAAGIGGFSRLQTISGSVFINNNETLKVVAEFPKLASITEDMQIYGNDALISLPPFKSLKSIGGYLQIKQNDSLPVLDGFTALETSGTAISDDFAILENAALSRLDGFDKLTHVQNFHIQQNSDLPNNHAQCLKDRLTVKYYSVISYNAADDGGGCP